MSRVKKVQRPIILWENKVQMAIWEILLKGEVDSGFWSKSKFDTMSYLAAQSVVFPKCPGTTIVPSRVGFDFESKRFVSEQGYYVAIIIKLTLKYPFLDISDLHKLAVFAESLIMIDFKDDNSDYRRIQVIDANINERNIPPEYKETLGITIKHFKELGIEMQEVTETLKDNPLERKVIRKVLNGMSALLKKHVSYEELQKHLSSN